MALLAHILLAVNKFFHHFLEFLLEGVSLALEKVIAFPGSYDLLFVELKVPKLGKRHIRLAVIC